MSEKTLVDAPRPDEVEDLCTRLEGAYSTVFERNLAREAASLLRSMNFLRDIARIAIRRAELAEIAEQDIERELTQAQARCAEVEKLLREISGAPRNDPNGRKPSGYGKGNWCSIMLRAELVERLEAALKE